MKDYDPKQIEPKWQKYWEDKKLFEASDTEKKPKYYALMEFPYPSSDGLHTGHVRGYTAMDIVARKRRMEGYNVLFPIGWDAFGLPTENYAIKTGRPPADITKENTENFRREFKSMGISFDWSREVNTTDPKYYKWTQWIFLKLLENSLAYKAKIAINWCPKDKIGLANEEVVNGCCERCGTPVEKREKEQWMLAITKYADRLDKDLDTVDFPERVKLSQRNWIGRSEGAEIEFEIVPTPHPLPERKGEYGYHTGDPKIWKKLQDKAIEMRETPTQGESLLWKAVKGNSLDCHFRQQHIIDRFIVDFVCLEKKLIVEVDGDIHDYQKQDDDERTALLNEQGFMVLRFKNEKVVENIKEVLEKISSVLKALPFGEGLGGDVSSVKVFTTRPDTIFGATYMVLAPEHELMKSLMSKVENKEEVENYTKDTKKKSEIDRTGDKEKTGVELKGVKAINPATKEEIPVWIADYVLPHYGTGAIMAVPADDERDMEFAKKFNLPIVENYQVAGFEDFGEKKTTFKLRDWVFSRQRYWGEPIPVIHCDKCGMVPVPEKDLPVLLPEVAKYEPTDTGESPLASIESWVNVKCPKCGEMAKRETDTMPNWAGSSWYFLRYTDPKNDEEFASREKLDHWTPVDWYNGGMEHTTLHLLYSRFWNKFLFDLKLVPTSEPYQKRTSHGFILAENGEKMSKSRGNVVNPDDIVNRFGADTLRLYEMFMGPFEQAISWNEDSLVGPRRFLERVWKLQYRITPPNPPLKVRGGNEGGVKLNKTIRKVTDDIELMGFNTAVSSLMILVNALEKQTEISQNEFEILIKLLYPFAPHITEELWNELGHQDSIVFEPWPEFDEDKIEDEEVVIGIQVNGKLRTTFKQKADASEDEVRKAVLALPGLAKWLDGESPKKVIVVLGKIVNIVV